jgi:Fe2+ or Zn2+ uptake regulation protein
MGEADRLKSVITRHSGFAPDFTHFAISGLCEACQPQSSDRAS